MSRETKYCTTASRLLRFWNAPAFSRNRESGTAASTARHSSSVRTPALLKLLNEPKVMKPRVEAGGTVTSGMSPGR